ncbi:hypothetical protein [Phaeobacter porticola]|uniref:Uncharacterized protein n=1 Tax=Phaeobacter porticola TaxID=1844006 RepID=A0A1L3I3W7_9RHOB|nr:hypothetical protein [Phaeobacter porticola]APG46692.1 hypothetical protein PhaeoP97_01267 [Phaeobacter porticola]
MIRGDGAEDEGETAAPFVARKTYRRRRLMDVAKLLPVLGALLFAVPLMWPDADPYPAPDSVSGMPLSQAMIYILVVWAGLILASFFFAMAVRRWAEHWTEGGETGRGGDPD